MNAHFCALGKYNKETITENEDLEQEKERRLSGNRELEKQQQKLQKELETFVHK